MHWLTTELPLWLEIYMSILAQKPVVKRLQIRTPNEVLDLYFSQKV